MVSQRLGAQLHHTWRENRDTKRICIIIPLSMILYLVSPLLLRILIICGGDYKESLSWPVHFLEWWNFVPSRRLTIQEMIQDHDIIGYLSPLSKDGRRSRELVQPSLKTGRDYPMRCSLAEWQYIPIFGGRLVLYPPKIEKCTGHSRPGKGILRQLQVHLQLLNLYNLQMMDLR